MRQKLRSRGGKEKQGKKEEYSLPHCIIYSVQFPSQAASLKIPAWEERNTSYRSWQPFDFLLLRDNRSSFAWKHSRRSRRRRHVRVHLMYSVLQRSLALHSWQRTLYTKLEICTRWKELGRVIGQDHCCLLGVYLAADLQNAPGSFSHYVAVCLLVTSSHSLQVNPRNRAGSSTTGSLFTLLTCLSSFEENITLSRYSR